MALKEKLSVFWAEIGEPFLAREGAKMPAQEAADALTLLAGGLTVVQPTHVNNHRSVMKKLPERGAAARERVEANRRKLHDLATADNTPPPGDRGPQGPLPNGDALALEAALEWLVGDLVDITGLAETEVRRRLLEGLLPTDAEVAAKGREPGPARSWTYPVEADELWGGSVEAFRQSFDAAVAEVRRLEQIAGLCGIVL